MRVRHYIKYTCRFRTTSFCRVINGQEQLSIGNYASLFLSLVYKKAMLSQGEPRDVAVNFDTYRILAYNASASSCGSSATARLSCIHQPLPPALFSQLELRCRCRNRHIYDLTEKTSWPAAETTTTRMRGKAQPGGRPGWSHYNYYTYVTPQSWILCWYDY